MKPFMARVNSSQEDSPNRSEDRGGDHGCGKRARRVGCVKMVLVALVCLSAMLMVAPAAAQIAAEAKNVVLIAHHNLMAMVTAVKV